MPLTRNQKQVLSLIAISSLAHVTMSGGRVCASLFMLSNSNSELLAGLTYGAYSLMPALLSLHLGRLVDREGARRMMHISQIVMILGLLAPSLWPAAWSVLGAALISGLGFASYMLAANVSVSLMPFEHDSERIGMLGWLASSNSIAAITGPAISGFMIDHGGFSGAYATLCGMVVISYVGSFYCDIPGDRLDAGVRKTGSGSVVKMVFAEPRLLRIYLLAMAIAMSWDGFSFMTPVLGHERGFSATTIGMIMASFACGSFAVRAALPWLSRKFGDWQLLSFSFAAIASIFLLLLMVKTPGLYAALGFVFGFAVGQGQPVILGLIYRAMPEGKAGEGAGLRSMMASSTGAVAPSIYGAVSSLFGAFPVFLGIAFFASLASWQARLGHKIARALKEQA